MSKLIGDGGRSIGPIGESGRSGEESPSSPLPPVTPGGEDWVGECRPPRSEDSWVSTEESPPEERCGSGHGGGEESRGPVSPPTLFLLRYSKMDNCEGTGKVSSSNCITLH